MPEGWSVLYQQAVEQWLARARSNWDVARLLDWLNACSEGPPSDGVLIFTDDELYAARVPGPPLSLRTWVVAYEWLMILKEID